MSDQSVLVSNGTCYSAAGTKLAGSFIPCGNDAFGHQTCCGAGDNCLADNACFGFHGSGYGSYLTYMAGCSDPDYKDSSCPDKDGIDQPWIALTLCDNSGGAWAACSQEGNPSTLQPGSYCSCTNAASATVAFSDTNSLTSVCSLPTSTGLSISFFPGHTPTTPTSSGTSASASGAGSSSGSTTPSQTGSKSSTSSGTGTGNSGSATSTHTGSITSSPSGTGTSSGGSAASTRTGSSTSTSSGTGAGSSGTSSPSTTGTTSSAGSTSSGLSSGAKVGIGVGAGVGALILLVAIAALFFLRRKRRRHSPPETESGSAIDTKSTKPDSSDHQRVSAMSTKPTTAWEADGQEVAEVGGRAAHPWPTRNELEGRQVAPNLAEHTWGNAAVGDAHEGRVRRSGDLNPVAELPGSEGWQVEDRNAQGVGKLPTQGGGPGPRQGPRYRGVEMTSQATPPVGGLSVVGPEGVHFPGEQGAGNPPA